VKASTLHTYRITEKFYLSGANMSGQTYVGFHQDKHALTQLGRVVLDAWQFG